jgi:hypothetical protein
MLVSGAELRLIEIRALLKSLRVPNLAGPIKEGEKKARATLTA